ncbi:MAG: hypothetical protein JJLCMIEE_01464 [Acidimicrobiales bacterium]|nr:MAG: SAM-dependent methyltransferase [Actinomycetota bacterium]MBV6508403.1 hypothetical protein [Acidimicrobiales bacterium]RIK04786.1 MAG: SAM-dependent methyltransferase [Acidobacteriota bacterium]
MGTSKTIGLEADIQQYLIDHSIPRTGVHTALVEATENAVGNMAIMQIPEEQGAFMTLLAKMTAPEIAVEVGTFTGYSALCIAQGLPTHGKLIACDISDDYTSLAKPFWEEAGVAEKIDLRIGPAIDTLRALPDDEAVGLAFIDADKESYRDYYEELLKRLEHGGLIVVDNVLLFGTVTQPSHDSAVKAMKEFNRFVAADDRVDVSMINVADGLSLIRKR